MNAIGFDTLARSLTVAGSRRMLLSTACAGVLSTLRTDQSEAKKKRPCPPCKKRKHGKCKTELPDGTACAGGTCQGGGCIAVAAPSPQPPPGPLPAPPPAPTCSDGIRNGAETDLDCGGTCPRCPDFKSCASRDDCRGALCVGDVCRVCDPAIANQCKGDASGACVCQTRKDGQRFCAQTNFVNAATCPLCPNDTNCVDIGVSSVRCFKLCGTPL
jgi:hypothetical protein